MLAGMTSTQWEEWKEYMRVEPFEEERMDQRFGHLAAIFLNRYRKRGTKALSMEEATLRFGDTPVAESAVKPMRKSWQAMKAFAKTLVMGE